MLVPVVPKVMDQGATQMTQDEPEYGCEHTFDCWTHLPSRSLWLQGRADAVPSRFVRLGRRAELKCSPRVLFETRSRPRKPAAPTTLVRG
jgi:hypothetical protein